LGPAEDKDGFYRVNDNLFSDTNSLSPSSSLGPDEAQRPMRTQHESRHGFTVLTITYFSGTNSLSPLLRWVRTRRKAHREPSVNTGTPALAAQAAAGVIMIKTAGGPRQNRKR
jgi:hypothetical protein